VGREDGRWMDGEDGAARLPDISDIWRNACSAHRTVGFAPHPTCDAFFVEAATIGVIVSADPVIAGRRRGIETRMEARRDGGRAVEKMWKG
jgi:hypothetical protein